MYIVTFFFGGGAIEFVFKRFSKLVVVVLLGCQGDHHAFYFEVGGARDFENVPKRFFQVLLKVQRSAGVGGPCYEAAAAGPRGPLK